MASLPAIRAEEGSSSIRLAAFALCALALLAAFALALSPKIVDIRGILSPARLSTLRLGILGVNVLDERLAELRVCFQFADRRGKITSDGLGKAILEEAFLELVGTKSDSGTASYSQMRPSMVIITSSIFCALVPKTKARMAWCLEVSPTISFWMSRL